MVGPLSFPTPPIISLPRTTLSGGAIGCIGHNTHGPGRIRCIGGNLSNKVRTNLSISTNRPPLHRHDARRASTSKLARWPPATGLFCVLGGFLASGRGGQHGR